MEFSEIHLTKDEYQALKATEGGSILLTVENKDIFHRLADLEFVAIYPATGCKSDYGTFPKCASITPRGQNYLRYIAAEKATGRKRVLFEVVLVLLSSAVTLLLEHFHELLVLFQLLLDKLF